MYEKYTKQPLPDKHYRELLGSALCVFNSNNAFIIENILRCDDLDKYNWVMLIDLESGHLKGSVHDVITARCSESIESLFAQLIIMRNRIIHSFQITTKDGHQILATKEREKDGGKQFVITEEYLLDFITKNEKLSSMLHEFRGY